MAAKGANGTPNVGAGKLNTLVIWGDDIGITNLCCYSDGLMGYRTPNIDRVANEGMRFTDHYGEQNQPPTDRRSWMIWGVLAPQIIQDSLPSAVGQVRVEHHAVALAWISDPVPEVDLAPTPRRIHDGRERLAGRCVAAATATGVPNRT